MGFITWLIRGDDDWGRGWDAANELHDMIDHEPSDEEWDLHCKAVKDHHSDEYVQGYADYLESASTPWWKFW